MVVVGWVLAGKLVVEETPLEISLISTPERRSARLGPAMSWVGAWNGYNPKPCSRRTASIFTLCPPWLSQQRAGERREFLYAIAAGSRAPPRDIRRRSGCDESAPVDDRRLQGTCPCTGSGGLWWEARTIGGNNVAGGLRAIGVDN